jgi:D-serine deaminase-like pyridoxal phosphate-dependent protein
MSVHTSLEAIETPAGVADLTKVRANLERVVSYCREHGIGWRPHIKTHKCTRLARLQLEAGVQGLTVATPREAEVMSTVCDDLLLAYPVMGDSKLDRVMAIPDHVRLTVGLDSDEALRAVAAAAERAGRAVRILVEVDLGMSRVGLETKEEAVRLAGRVREIDGVEYAGLMFYPGHIRGPQEGQDAELEILASDLRALYQALDEEDLSPEVVSGGSTPTLWRSHELPGLTEIRSGTAIFFDREGLNIGVATADDMAYTVLATVVSTSIAGQAAIDAGSKALSKEGRGGDEGFAVLLDHPDVVVKGVSEEHGVLDLSKSDWRPRVGDRVRVLPNHVCVSVNLQDDLLVLIDGAVERWPLEARGRRHFSAEDQALVAEHAT